MLFCVDVKLGQYPKGTTQIEGVRFEIFMAVKIQVEVF
jgi:hypothetical protein